MPKITELAADTSFQAGDIIVKDGTNGTKKITIENVVAYLHNVLGDNTANDYDPTQTYPNIGTYAVYEGQLYKSKVAITTAEAFTAAHWDEVKLGDELSALSQHVDEGLEQKAGVDGHYEQMTVGNAEQLISTAGVSESVPYNFRASGGDADIGDREVEKIIGGTVAWNQLLNIDHSDYASANVEFTNNHDGSITLNGTANEKGSVQLTGTTVSVAPGHKYYLSGYRKIGSNAGYFGFSGLIVDKGSGGIWANPSYTALYPRIDIISGDSFDNVTMRPMYIDLTQLFGSTIADYIYSLEQASEGAGVAWFRGLFPKPYYAYDAGSLQSVKAKSHVLVGFNAYNPTSGKAHVVGGNVYQITGTYTGLSLDGTTVTPDGNGKFTPSANGELTVTGGGSDTCVHLVWDGSRDGEYEPYTEHVYDLDPDLELRGIPKLDSGNKLYYDGDTYESDGTVTRRYGIVDLGTLTWTYNTSGTNPIFVAQISDRALSGHLICKYVYGGEKTNTGLTTDLGNNMCATHENSASVFVIRDDSYTDAATFKAAMSGVMLVYELATPTTETADPYQNPQIVDDFGTEEYIDAGTTASTPTRDVAIPVGHETKYLTNLRKRVEEAPDSPASNGDYVLRQTSGNNKYIPFTVENMIAPKEAGYTATRNYTAGQYVIVEYNLYQVVSNIANGGAITPGSNVIATTIGEQLTLLASLI